MTQEKTEYPRAYSRPMSDFQVSKIKRMSKRLGLDNPLDAVESNFVSLVQASAMIHPFEDIVRGDLTKEQYMNDLRWSPKLGKIVHKDDVVVDEDRVAVAAEEALEEEVKEILLFVDKPYRYKLNTIEEAIVQNATPGKAFNSLHVFDWLYSEDQEVWLNVFDGNVIEASKDVSETVNKAYNGAPSSGFPLDSVEGRNQRYIWYPDGIPEPVAEQPTRPVYELRGTTIDGQDFYSYDGKYWIFTEFKP